MSEVNSSLARLGDEVQALSELGLAVFRVNGLLLQWGDLLVAPVGLTSARWQMLGALALSEVPLTSPQVGSAMGVTRQGAQKQLNALQELGLVEPKPNPAHKRSPVYRLTPEGRALYAKAEQLWARETAVMAKKLTPEQARGATLALEALERLLRPAARLVVESE